MKKLLIVLVALVVVALGASLVFTANDNEPAESNLDNEVNPSEDEREEIEETEEDEPIETGMKTADLNHINYLETFEQEDPEYFVYFYQEECSYCKEIEPTIVQAHQNDVPIYVVDMRDPGNSEAWYDWEAHHERYTRVIGEVRDGEWIFAEGESEELYGNEEDGWIIRPNENDELIVELGRPLNNIAPQFAQQIQISGTPTLIRIKDGEFAGYAVGVEEGEELLGLFEQ